MNIGQPLGMALIGCGNIGVAGHVPAYRNVPEVALRAVCDLDTDRSAAVAADTGARTAQLEEILGDPSIDAVDITVPTRAHHAVVGAALDAGKHILVEKPIAVDLNEAEAMVTNADAAGLVLMVGHVRRFDDRYVKIAGELAAGTVGRPRYLRRAERQRLPLSVDAWPWSERGGGVLMDVGIHVVDLVRWLLGEPTSVYATSRRVRDEAKETANPDHVFMTFALADGVTAVGEASWAHPAPFGPFYGALEVVGTEGILALRDSDGPLVIIGPDGVEHPRYGPLLSTLPSAFSAQLRHFARVVSGGETPRQTAHDAARSLSLCLAAAESLAKARPVAGETSR